MGLYNTTTLGEFVASLRSMEHADGTHGHVLRKEALEFGMHRPRTWRTDEGKAEANDLLVLFMQSGE